jgi:ribonuclease HI
MTYYAVYIGHNPGIYMTWDAVKKEVDGFPGAVFRGFKNIKDAEYFTLKGELPAFNFKDDKDKDKSAASLTSPATEATLNLKFAPLPIKIKPLIKIKQAIGVKEPIIGVKEPISIGVKEPISIGVKEPIIGVKEPIRGIKEPIRGVKEPIRGVKEPIRGVKEPIRGVKEPIRAVKSSRAVEVEVEVEVEVAGAKAPICNTTSTGALLKLVSKYKNHPDYDPESTLIHIYTDGGTIGNGRKDATGAYGVFIPETYWTKERLISRDMVSGKITNGVAELKAIIKALTEIMLIDVEVDSDIELEFVIHYDSTYAADVITGKKGAKANLELVQKGKQLLKECTQIASVEFEHVYSHTGAQDLHSLGNVVADKLAEGTLMTN